jgi:hypothetical protein
LKDLCQFLEIERSGSREDQISSISKFLNKPKESGNASLADMSPAERAKANGKRKSKAKGKSDGKKKRLNGYMTFGNEMRSQIVEENPDMQTTEVVKELGRLWREMSEEEKTVYNDKAKAPEEPEKDEDEEEAGDQEEEAAEEEEAEDEEAEDEGDADAEAEEESGEKDEEKEAEAEPEAAEEAGEEDGEAEFEG